MTRSQLNAYNNAQDSIVLGSTSLKMRVVMLFNGEPLQCAECNTVAEVKTWAKKAYNELAAIGTDVSRITFRME